MHRPVHNHLPIVIKYTINISILFKKFSQIFTPIHKKALQNHFYVILSDLSLDAPGRPWTPLDAPGRPWTPLDAPGRPWTPLDAPGRPWTPLDAPGRPWTPLDAPGRPWTPLDAPGRPWTPLDAPGRPWTPLDAPGRPWTPLYLNIIFKNFLKIFTPPSPKKVLQNHFQVILSDLSLDAPVRPCTPLRPCVKTRFA